MDRDPYDDDDLPDTDYRALHGEEALLARTFRRLSALEQKQLQHHKALAQVTQRLASTEPRVRTPEEHTASMARFDDLIAQAKALPSLPEMARALTALTEEVTQLKTRVKTLEQDCDALRQQELLRLWETPSPDEDRPQEENI